VAKEMDYHESMDKYSFLTYLKGFKAPVQKLKSVADEYNNTCHPTTADRKISTNVFD